MRSPLCVSDEAFLRSLLSMMPVTSHKVVVFPDVEELANTDAVAHGDEDKDVDEDDDKPAVICLGQVTRRTDVTVALLSKYLSKFLCLT